MACYFAFVCERAYYLVTDFTIGVKPLTQFYHKFNAMYPTYIKEQNLGLSIPDDEMKLFELSESVGEAYCSFAYLLSLALERLI